MGSLRPSHRRRVWHNAAVALTSSIVALSFLAGSPTPTLATHSRRGFDVDPETETVNAGVPVTLTALIDAADHDAGAGGDGRTVRFFFRPGSPSDTPASPDLECTVVLGACSVSYVPTVNGADLICATTHDDERHCQEEWNAPEGGNKEDVVQRIVVNGATASPTKAPTPSPTATPTPMTTLAPTAPPDPVPLTTPTPTPTPTLTPVPKDGHPFVEGSSADVAPGQTVALTVWMLRSDGSRATEQEGDADVRFFFLAGSANDQRTRRTDPDLRCRTGSDAWCSVTYVARNVGVDIICAHVGAPGRWETMCAESWDARDFDNGADVVRRRVAIPLPVPVPALSPESPSPTPTPQPSEKLVVPVATDHGSTSPQGPAPALPVPPAPASTPPIAAETESRDVLWQVWSAIVEGVERAVRPEAAAKVASTFGFPLALMLAVLVFLVVQDQIDRRDPKLRSAPRTVHETLVKFRDEDEL